MKKPVVLKAVEQDSRELAIVRRVQSTSLPIVRVLRVVDDYCSVLGSPMALLVMPYHTPLLDWVRTASAEDVSLAVASMCEVCSSRL